MSSLAARLGGMDGAVLLDAFAGSGALGLEALSRGAERATFIERDRDALRALKSNIALLGLEAQASVLGSDALSLAGRGVPGGPFTLILLDPPYTLDQTTVLGFLGELARSCVMAPGAIISLEHSAGTTVDWPEAFEVLSSKRYGSTAIDIAAYDQGEGSL